MATVSSLINSGLCAFQDLLGTETSKGCTNQIKAAKSIWLIAPGAEFRAGEDYEAEKERLILASKLIPLKGVNTFEENGSEDAVETLSDDTQIVTNEGKYKFTATFTSGLYFNKALHSVKGYRNWNVIIIDGDGVYGTSTTGGGLTGFTTGMMQPAKLTIGSNSAGQKEGIMFQFLDRAELDQDFAFISDSSARKQKGVTQIELSLVNAPADTDTTLTVKAVLAQDKSIAFTGVDYQKFLVTAAGVTANPTAGDDSATEGTYVLTVGALVAAQEGSVKLFDNSGNTSVVKGADGDYYKSNLLTYTVAA